MASEPDLPALQEAFRGPLIGALLHRGLPRDEAVDVAQDVFVEAFLKRERFDGDWNEPSRAGPWLFGIARNLARTWARGREREVARLEAPEQLVAPVAEVGGGEEVRAAIQRLRPEHREVVLMRYFEDSSLAQVAALLNLSVRAVEGRLYKARAELRRLLEDSAGRAHSSDAKETGS